MSPTTQHYGRQPETMLLWNVGGAHGAHTRVRVPHGHGGADVQQQHNTQHQHATPMTHPWRPAAAQQAYQYSSPWPPQPYTAMPPTTPMPPSRMTPPTPWGIGTAEGATPMSYLGRPTYPTFDHAYSAPPPTDAYPHGCIAAAGSNATAGSYGLYPRSPGGGGGHDAPASAMGGAAMPTAASTPLAHGTRAAGGDPATRGAGVSSASPNRWPNPEAAEFEHTAIPTAAAAAAGERLTELMARMAALEAMVAHQPCMQAAAAPREWKMPGTEELKALRTELKPADVETWLRRLGQTAGLTDRYMRVIVEMSGGAEPAALQAAMATEQWQTADVRLARVLTAVLAKESVYVKNFYLDADRACRETGAPILTSGFAMLGLIRRVALYADGTDRDEAEEEFRDKVYFKLGMPKAEVISRAGELERDLARVPQLTQGRPYALLHWLIEKMPSALREEKKTLKRDLRHGERRREGPMWDDKELAGIIASDIHAASVGEREAAVAAAAAAADERRAAQAPEGVCGSCDLACCPGARGNPCAARWHRKPSPEENPVRGADGRPLGAQEHVELAAAWERREARRAVRRAAHVGDVLGGDEGSDDGYFAMQAQARAVDAAPVGDATGARTLPDGRRIFTLMIDHGANVNLLKSREGAALARPATLPAAKVTGAFEEHPPVKVGPGLELTFKSGPERLEMPMHDAPGATCDVVCEDFFERRGIEVYTMTGGPLSMCLHWPESGHVHPLYKRNGRLCVDLEMAETDEPERADVGRVTRGGEAAPRGDRTKGRGRPKRMAAEARPPRVGTPSPPSPPTITPRSRPLPEPTAESGVRSAGPRRLTQAREQCAGRILAAIEAAAKREGGGACGTAAWFGDAARAIVGDALQLLDAHVAAADDGGGDKRSGARLAAVRRSTDKTFGEKAPASRGSRADRGTDTSHVGNMVVTPYTPA